MNSSLFHAIAYSALYWCMHLLCCALHVCIFVCTFA